MFCYCLLADSFFIIWLGEWVYSCVLHICILLLPLSAWLLFCIIVGGINFWKVYCIYVVIGLVFIAYMCIAYML